MEQPERQEPAAQADRAAGATRGEPAARNPPGGAQDASTAPARPADSGPSSKAAQSRKTSRQKFQIAGGLLIAVGSLLTAVDRSGGFRWASVVGAVVVLILVAIAVVDLRRRR